MALTINKKKTIISKINQDTHLAKSIITADFRGISVNTVNSFRKKAASHKIRMYIIKNTLLKLALQKTHFDYFSKAITGPTLIAFSIEHPGSAAKLFKNFEKKDKNFKIKSAAFEGNILTNSEINDLALMPTYKEAIILIIIILKNITVGKLMQLLLLIKKQKNC